MPRWSRNPVHRRAAQLATLAVAALALHAAPAAAETVVTVTTTADVVNGGDGVASLREAITSANGDADATVVELAASATYSLTLCGADEDANASGDLDSTAPGALTVNGHDATIQQTCAGQRVLDIIHEDSETQLNDLTLTGGNGVFDGAGVQFAGDLALTGATVSGNAASPGGRILSSEPSTSGTHLDVTDSSVGPNTGTGIAVSFGTVVITDSSVSDNTGRGLGLVDGILTITGSTISDNGSDGARTTGQGAGTFAVTDSVVADNGGVGIICSACGDLDVTDSQVTGNEPAGSTRGGGIQFSVDMDAPGDEPTVTVLRSTVADNTSDGPGGGLYLNVIEASDGGPAHVAIDASSFLDNHAAGASGRGGGVFATTGEVTLRNATFSGNEADVSGGAVTGVDEPVSLRHATIAGNLAPAAAGVEADAGLDTFGSVVAANPGGDCVVTGGTTSGGGNVAGDGSCGIAAASDQPAAGDPKLGAPADNGGPTFTRLPADDSPVLGAVSAAACTVLTVDQRGVARPQGPDCEAGAVEIVEPACTITGTPGRDILFGTNGDDVICGLGGHDLLFGFGGDDTMDGGLGSDLLLGGHGDDDLTGGPGLDILIGGPGSDTLHP